MAIYYVTICLLAGLGYVLTEKKRDLPAASYYPAFVFAVLLLVASFRYAIGFDYFSYQNFYEQMSVYTCSDILRMYPYEPLFFLVCRCFSLLGCSYPVFLVFVNIFLLFTVLFFLRRFSKLFWVSVYLYITLQFFAYHMNLLRQSIALSFFLLAYPYLKNKKILPFTALLLIGGLFHNSLWFLFPFYFLLPKKMNGTSIGLLLGAAITGYLFFDPLFQFFQPLVPEKYRLYQISYFWNASTADYVIPSAIYMALVFLLRRRVTDPVSRAIYLNSALYNLCISLFLTKHFILERFAVYPFAFSLLAIPQLIVSDSGEHSPDSGKQQRVRKYLTLLFLLFGACYFLFAVEKGFHNVYPYVSLFDKSQSVPIVQP